MLVQSSRLDRRNRISLTEEKPPKLELPGHDEYKDYVCRSNNNCETTDIWRRSLSHIRWSFLPHNRFAFTPDGPPDMPAEDPLRWDSLVEDGHAHV